MADTARRIVLASRPDPTTKQSRRKSEGRHTDASREPAPTRRRFDTMVPSRTHDEREADMTRILRSTVSISTLAALVLLAAPTVSYSQTDGQQRRDERQDDRQGAQDTRQEGRSDARDAKQECKEGDEKTRAECRKQKRDMKQDSRQKARDIKQND